MPSLRPFIPFITYIALIACLLFLSSNTDGGRYSESGHNKSSNDPLKSFFTFHGPGSLFAPAAIISLTDDNSTFFNARPAAFGPFLPDYGLSGPVWSGHTFPNGDVPNVGSIAADGGELGCGDIPGWHPFEESIPDSNQSPENHIRYSEIKPKINAGAWPISDEMSEEGVSESIGSVGVQNRPGVLDLSEELKGKIALLSRGGCGFLEKVLWAQRRGATAVIMGDNLRGGPLVTMYAKGDTSNVSIPSLFTSHMTAHLISSLVPDLSESDLTQSDGDSRLRRPDTNATRTDEYHQDLWVTLSITNIGANPFFNTLFVLVVSPLITLAVVYVMLLVRARIRRRRWRAPKSVVERLPVRVYRTCSSRPSPRMSPTATTPLLINNNQQTSQKHSLRQSESSQAGESIQGSSYGSVRGSSSEREKRGREIPQVRRKYNQKQVECSVCLEEYEDGVSRVMSLPCGHDFHADCVTPWLTTKRRTCPICKGDVVRSLGELDGTLPARSPRHSSQEGDVQNQAAGIVNESPSAMRPISVHSDDVHEDLDIERDVRDRHV